MPNQRSLTRNCPPSRPWAVTCLRTTRSRRSDRPSPPMPRRAAARNGGRAGLWWLTPLHRLLDFHRGGHRDARRGPRVARADPPTDGVGPVRDGRRPLGERSRLSRHSPATPPDLPRDPTIPRATRRWMSLAEGDPLGAVFLPRLWCWAYVRSKAGGRQRDGSLPRRPGPSPCAYRRPLARAQDGRRMVYAGLGDRRELGLSPADGPPPAPDYGDTPLSQTHTLRGRIIPCVFLELTYHLEHYLIPRSPATTCPSCLGDSTAYVPGGRRPAVTRPVSGVL